MFRAVSSKAGKRRQIVFTSIVTFLWLVKTVIKVSQWEFVADAFALSEHRAASTVSRLNKFRDGLPGNITTYVLRGLSTFLANLILVCLYALLVDRRLNPNVRSGTVTCCMAVAGKSRLYRAYVWGSKQVRASHIPDYRAHPSGTVSFVILL